ncbi:hypothetical protein [Emcibacter nanhaiensis]|uniref:DUF2946 domain-containing protein n=1 Tax=Emcibacter nanhaiensis TaxID=1505037 RepID=A0A501PAJ6_9PROT|nr:hypothetical protein [Emcibacter nanhaiensis]TPD57255.1 hypothetical protein FIV46_14085 [Emcibacter nanhaiensis]
MKRVRQVISLAVLLLVAVSATGVEHSAARACEHAAAVNAAGMSQDMPCHEDMSDNSAGHAGKVSCHCDAMLSCSAVILPADFGGREAFHKVVQAFNPAGNIPEEYLAPLHSPPPRTMI